MHASLPPLRAREPILNLPGIVAAVVLALVAVHAARFHLFSEDFDFGLLLDLAVVPARWTAALDPSRADAILREAAEGFSGREALVRQALAEFILADAGAKPWTAVTYAALHGSWTHVLLNSVWLAAFGTPVARRCGGLRFALLMLAAAIGGALAHGFVHPLSSVPMIGASAAVSGLMAAAARFVFASGEPGPAGWPTQGLGDLLRNRRAALFLAIWFGTNLLFGLIATPLGITDASIAWEAHIGGFVVGLLLFPVIERGRHIPVRRK
jgi:membrane associated rhomboid family serine protease